MADTAATKASYSTDPALYIYTSLTAGSSHIVTATSRLETILRANRVPFKALDIATDEKARMLWGRRAGKDESGRPRKLPALVQMGLILGDLVEIEDWNEYGELKQHVTIYYDDFTIPPKSQAPVPNPLKPIGHSKPAAAAATSKPASATPTPAPEAPPLPDKKENEASNTAQEHKKSGAASAVASATLPIRSIAEEAAQKAKQIHLNTLREKAYGKKGKDTDAPKADESKDAGQDSSKEPEAVAAATEGDKKAETVAEAVTSPPVSLEKDASIDSTASSLTIASAQDKGVVGPLQSPTSGAWKSSSEEDHLRQVLQSPTSGTWKSGDFVKESQIRQHRGSTITNASAEEIAAVEEAETIQEVTSEEESDDHEEEDKKDATK